MYTRCVFYADLHVHSKYSRATSPDCDLERLYFWGRKKGIGVVGTGDFTHPAWLAEIREKLVPAEPGLFRLREELERAQDERLQTAPVGPTRFMLSVEISNIYKRDGKTRKVHNLIYVPDLESAERFAARLARIGNIASDGRPILGLDSRDLLEIALESGPGSYLVPAHVWTPWFAVLGSKSGFDAIDACYADLAPHVFALETGLSSDPAMNWRLSQLDRFRLVSNSDAHSPGKLGREATAFATELDYFAIRNALETGAGFGGTVEFFPEEGKYHLDGHRKCGICLTPEQARETEGLCPVCKKPLTLGVLHRVSELADRPDGSRLEGAAPYDCLVPLPEVLAETLGTGATSQKVQTTYERLLGKLGAELHILRHAPLEDVEQKGGALVAEAISRMRQGKVVRQAGYDGEYGVIRMFEPGELRDLRAGSLFPVGSVDSEPARDGAARAASTPALEPAIVPIESAQAEARTPADRQRPELTVPAIAGATAGDAVRGPASSPDADAVTSVLRGLDPEQAQAAAITTGPLLIIAGPGTGKTRTLTHRLAHLVRERGVPARACLAITFTRRAADEMRERLTSLLGAVAAELDVFTFHALGAAILRAHGAELELPANFRIASEAERLALLRETLSVSARSARSLLGQISVLKRTRATAVPGSELEQAYATYQRHLRAAGSVDFDDLVALAVELLERRSDLRAAYAERYRYVSIDEYQDIDELQYRLVRLIVPEQGNLCAIGDPDQAIYSFRGADVRFFVNFARDFPGAAQVQLTRNYRSTPVIVRSALDVIAGSSLVPGRKLEAQPAPLHGPNANAPQLTLHEAPDESTEAEYIVRRIEQLIGGYDFHAIDRGRLDSGDGCNLGFGDFAVLYRTSRQLDALELAFTRAGIPFQRRSHARLADDARAQALLAAVLALSEGTVVERLRAAAALHGDPDSLRPVLEMLSPFAAQAGSDAERFASALLSHSEIDTWDPRAARVAVLTLHAAKGLEFDTVFIAGCEDGILPLRFGGAAETQAPARTPSDQVSAESDERDEVGVPDAGARTSSERDEECRLLFVGMTRARRQLVLTCAARRLWLGKVRERAPSPFLAAIRAEHVERTRAERQRLPSARRQLSLF